MEQKKIDIIIKDTITDPNLRNKISGELNTCNVSTFESSIDELIGVDIYEGIKCLRKFTKEGSSCDNTTKENAYEKSGLYYVEKRIRHYLIDSDIASNVLVEYSLLSSTLNPSDPDQLQCCSFVIGDETFKNNVNLFYTKSISKTEYLHSISIYQHPHFLYDIEKENLLTITRKDSSDKEYQIKPEEVTETEKSKYREYNKEVSIEAFGLPRNFKDMLLNAKSYLSSPDYLALSEIQESLHSYCHENITCKNKYDAPSIYASFPVYGSIASNQLPQYRISEKALQGIGACFIYFEPKPYKSNKEYSKEDYNEYIDEILNKLVYELGNLIRFLSANYMFNLGLQLQEKARKEAIRSAKAAIMARNMSHNLGSHVMSYLKQKLGNITSILNDDKVLYNIFDKGNGITNTTINNIQLPFLVGTGRFIGYLQERQDYIATIATDYIPYGAPVNLKDAIYDELNPDLRHKRHNDKNDNNRPLNVLLSYIAKSEGLSRENMDQEGFATSKDILIGFPKYTKDTKEPQIFGIGIDNCESENEALSEMRKINFNLPGGLVGRQAVFSIIENLIRNAAKHGNTRAVDNLEYTFDIINIGDISNEPCIEDRICSEKWRMLYEKAIDKNNLYLLTITDNLQYDTSIIEKLEPGLTEDYVDAFGKMTAGNKGLKEIRTSAAWLRSETDESKYMRSVRIYDKRDKKDKEIEVEGEGLAPLVAIELTSKGHLRYMICLPQDKLAAVIKPKSIDNREMFDELQKAHPNDWEYYDSVDEFKQDLKTVFRYIIVPDKETYKQLRPYTSNRLHIWKHIDKNSDDYKEWEKISKSATDETKEVTYTSKKNIVIRNLYDIDKNDEPIYVWDGTTNEVNNNNTYSKIKVFSGDSDTEHAKYVYRTHHATEKDFTTYWETKINSREGEYKKIECIDGITGDNSSDRLVRREPLNEEWYCAHLNAFRKKVAIFDERLFKIVHNIEDTEFVINEKANASEDGLASYLNKLTDDKNVDKIRDEILNLNMLPIEDWAEIFNINSREEIIKYLNSKTKTLQSLRSNNYKTVYYKEKGVDVFSIIKEKEGQFAIVGCTEISSKDGRPLCKYDRIATINYEMTEKSFSVKIYLDNREFKNKYDYLSIHQGLLDKLYEGFNIKHPTEKLAKLDEEKDVYENIDNCKEIVTKEIFNKFIKVIEDESKNGEVKHESQNISNQFFANQPISVYKINDKGMSIKEYDYLPNLIIHSGRAKPTRVDMPQKQPFIQYSAIEHGVLDCKYALVELLDYAKYEEQN